MHQLHKERNTFNTASRYHFLAFLANFSFMKQKKWIFESTSCTLGLNDIVLKSRLRLLNWARTCYVYSWLHYTISNLEFPALTDGRVTCCILCVCQCVYVNVLYVQSTVHCCIYVICVHITGVSQALLLTKLARWSQRILEPRLRIKFFWIIDASCCRRNISKLAENAANFVGCRNSLEG